MRAREVFRGIPLLAVVSAFACTNLVSDPIVCTAEFVYGVHITAVAASDGSPVTFGLAGELSEGSYSEAMAATGNELVGAGERAGTYAATVDADGFETWTRSDIVVAENECHVIPVSITAELIEEGED